jgi:hypothetical protein
MRTQFNKEIKSIADYLWANEYDGMVYFDHSSYDLETDIPHLLIDGELVYVTKFYINRDATFLEIVDDNNNQYTTKLTDIPEEWDDEYFDSMGMFELLRDVFYETEKSWEIGDYEMDFLEN